MAADISGWKIGDSALYKDTEILLSTGEYKSKGDDKGFQRIAAGGKK